MKRISLFLAFQILFVVAILNQFGHKTQPVVLPNIQLVTPAFLNLPPLPVIPVDPELVGVQVPLAHEQRIYNRSGSQCVWCTLQMLGRINHISQTEGLTDRYKGTAGPGNVKNVLDGLGVKFSQINSRGDDSFFDKYVTEKKYGAGIGIYGTHAILVVHWDKAGGVVKIIDNSDRSLSVQTWTMEKFKRAWDGWAFTVFPNGSTDTEFQQPEIITAEYLAWWNSQR